MILFFDTETTGFMNARKPVDHPDQAHVVQLAAQLVTPQNETFMEFSLVVNPGVPIPVGASNVHGITDDIAAKYGVKPKTAVRFFTMLLRHTELLVAHNIGFDDQVMQTAITRCGGDVKEFVKPQYCTMKNAFDVVKAPPTQKMIAAGRTHWKSPNLGECIKHFFDEELDGAHDAMVDVKACRRVYFELMKGGAA